jgi:hypothetical protein
MIFNTKKSGYTIDWGRLGSNNISKMIFDGVDFLEVYIEYFDYSWSVKIMVKVVPENKLGIVPPIVMTQEFSKELLESFDVNILDYPAIKADPERLLINLIKVTSNEHFWSKKMNTFLNSQQLYSTHTTPKNFSKVYQRAPIHSDAYSSDKDARIKELEEEIKDLKEEIEMLKAVNQEC